MSYKINDNIVITDRKYGSFGDTTISGGGYLNVSTSPLRGTVSGYTSGGTAPPSTNVDTIDKFPFATNANATDVGNLFQTRSGAAGQSSDVSGYSSGGITSPVAPLTTRTIDKFPFATDANATDVGDITQARQYAAGQSSGVSGYMSGGSSSTYHNTIDKFPFAADANATDVGDLTQTRNGTAGQSSTDYGYTSGGFSPPSFLNVIDKFPFASDANATDVGDLTQARQVATGQSSVVSGYTSGGNAPPYINTIDKFPFAADGNATDVGDLTQARYSVAGQSSDVSGYTSGGKNSAPPTTAPFYNTIDKFPFSADGDATDVGNLTQARQLGAGQQD